MSDLRLGILSTHPVQYLSPLYRAITARGDTDLTVYYAHRPTPEQQGEDFGVGFEWDIDLLGGYRSEFLHNRAAQRGRGFRGFDSPEIAGVIRKERFDAFLVSGWHTRSYWQALLACWRTRTPVLVRGDSFWQRGEPGWRVLAKKLVYRMFLSRIDAALSVGVRSEEYLRSLGAPRVLRVPHFVDNEFFDARKHPGAGCAARKRWGIGAEEFVVLFSGKLIHRKRPLDVLRAVAGLGAGARALIVGDGPLREGCEREAEALGVATTFAGFMNQRQIVEAYAASNVLVLPSVLDTWGLVVNEAMASGLPAVVADTVGCGPDLVVEGRTGFTYPVGDLNAFRDALEKVRAAKTAGVAMGEQAREFVRQFSVESAASALVTAARAVARPQRPIAAAPRERPHAEGLR